MMTELIPYYLSAETTIIVGDIKIPLANAWEPLKEKHDLSYRPGAGIEHYLTGLAFVSFPEGLEEGGREFFALRLNTRPGIVLVTLESR